MKFYKDKGVLSGGLGARSIFWVKKRSYCIRIVLCCKMTNVESLELMG